MSKRVIKLTTEEIERLATGTYRLKELKSEYRKTKTIFFQIINKWFEHMGKYFPINEKLRYKLVDTEKLKGLEMKVENEIANLDYKYTLQFPSLLTSHKKYLLEKIDELIKTDVNIYRGTHKHISKC